jgi:serpin B
VKLSYGTENYNMYIFLPEKGKTLQEIAGKLNKDNWETWMKNFQLTERVDIKFPRFKYSYDVNLNDALTKMGMGIALSGAADFSGINKNRNLHIDFVKHKSFIEVNEEGTEAAAVTSVGVRMVSIGNSPKTVPFHVNRPFFYAITEKNTDAVLFMGTVKNPQLN